MSDPFIYLQFIRQHMMALPGVTEGLSHGTPAFYVNKRMLTRLWENGEVLVVRTEERDKWMQADPETFFITDHYRNYPTMLIKMDRVQPDDLKQLLTDAWLGRASKMQIKEYEKNI
ncbi:MmcQ/YjbR family DNA-binding protein [Mucilaginibacter sp. McL0603]|uniref:MmcQ/YjbR family DNA-binding protein n=1 Tax=Mucilaginibacter sp. McL0603 TaxID=3415670 RepID=UPI003CF8F1CC